MPVNGRPDRRAARPRREQLRAGLWFVPALLVIAAGVLFAITDALDRAAHRGSLTLPMWLRTGSADAGRQILIGIAAAIITVVGVVFSITIVALTLASTQFGPRILRAFVRDRGTQVTLGAFVATFVYSILVLAAANDASDSFIPHVSIATSLLLVLVDLGVLIFFIDHIAKVIQLPRVVAGIASELSRGIDAAMVGNTARSGAQTETGPAAGDVIRELNEAGGVVAAASSGYLQVVRHHQLIRVAAQADAVILLLHRPGHFVVEGRPLAKVLPASAATEVQRGLNRAHATGPHRSLSQDIAFAIDQLVEIAIRALSPAVNDTFTGITCIDWLTDGLCRISARWAPEPVWRDAAGRVRVVEAELNYQRLVDRAFDKIRQAGITMPAILIRQLDSIARIVESTRDDSQRAVLVAQAEMIVSVLDAIPVVEDRNDVRRSYDLAMAAVGRAATTSDRPAAG